MKKAILIFIAFNICFCSINAQWNGDPNVANTRVCTANTAQTNSQIIPDGSGGAIIFWLDSRSGTGADIYYNKLNATGNAVWSPASAGLSLTNNGAYNYIDQVISDGSGGAFISWETNNEVLVQHVNNAGVKTWATTGISLSSTAQSGFLCSDGSGGVIVTWADYRADLVNENPVSYVQRINSSGTKMWAASGVLLTTSSGFSASIGIIPDGAGGAIIATIDTRNSNYDAVADEYDNIDIYAQRINASGNTAWAAAGVPVCTQSKNQNWGGGGQYPYIISDGAGGAVIAWEDYRNDPNNGNASPYNEDIFCQRLNASGAPQWTIDGIALCVAAGDQYQISLMPDGSGGAVAAWFDERNTFRIYAQKINGSGAAQWATNGIVVASESNSFTYTASPDATNSSMLVAWVANGGDIKAEKISVSTGNLNWGGVWVCGRSDYQHDPAITHNGAAGAIISWTDNRNSATSGDDIYANSVAANGTLPVTFINFEAALQSGSVQLSWSTATEINSKEFSIQRSLDGNSFETIGSVPAAGNSNISRSYRYEDLQAAGFAGRLIFYRIMETDIDGRLYYTGVKNVKIPDGMNKLTLVFNPVRDYSLLRYQSASNDKVKIRMIDRAGRVISATEQSVQRGINEIRLNTANLAKGIYEVDLSDNNDHYHVRIMKE